MRVIAGLPLIAGVAFSAGCAMCPPGYLDDYATVGGKWQRADPTSGRVGSVFSDPGAQVLSHQMAGDYHPSYGGEVYSEGEFYPNTPDSSVLELNPAEGYPLEGEFFEGESSYDPNSGSEHADEAIILGDEW